MVQCLLVNAADLALVDALEPLYHSIVYLTIGRKYRFVGLLMSIFQPCWVQTSTSRATWPSRSRWSRGNLIKRSIEEPLNSDIRIQWLYCGRGWLLIRSYLRDFECVLISFRYFLRNSSFNSPSKGLLLSISSSDCKVFE
jgi:hypothetical protein